MADKPPPPPKGILTTFLSQLRSSQLLMVLSGLFVLDLFVPDPIPFLDEILLAAVMVLYSQWKARRAQKTAAPSAEKPPTKNVTPPQPGAG